MWAYIARRLIQAIPVLIGISLLTFVLIYYLPADPARMYAGPSAKAETVDRIRHELGLDQPFWVQYGRYLERLLHGDLGFSYRKQIAVTELILSRLPYTLALIAGGVFVELLVGLTVGITSAIGRGRWMDRLGMFIARWASRRRRSGWACCCCTDSAT
jgi:peptide/nickel transport system permease protein